MKDKKLVREIIKSKSMTLLVKTRSKYMSKKQKNDIS